MRKALNIIISHSINRRINQFMTRHTTEARATMSLSQTEKECLNSVLENVNGWRQSDSSVEESSRVLVPRQRNDEQQCRCCEGETERRLCVDNRNERD